MSLAGIVRPGGTWIKVKCYIKCLIFSQAPRHGREVLHGLQVKVLEDNGGSHLEFMARDWNFQDDIWACFFFSSKEKRLFCY